MPKRRLGRPAVLAALLLALQLTQPQYALAKFRGAVQKPIPRVGNDGGMVYSVSGIIADLDNMSEPENPDPLRCHVDVLTSLL